MAGKQAKDEQWLKQQLVAALHWDDDVAEGVLGLIVNASKPEEVQEITAAYMDNNPVAVCAISDFLSAKRGGKQQPPRQQQQQQQQRQQPQQQQRGGQSAGGSSSYSSSVSAPASQQPTAKQQAAEAASSKQQQQEKWLQLGAQQPPATAEQGATPAADVGAQAPSTSKQAAEATLSMFKRGGRLATKPAAGSSNTGRRGKGEQLDSIGSKLERKVANCLSCGKIFDCRNVTNDIIRFIDSGFKCTFCGTSVAMSQQQRIQQAQQRQQQQQQADAGSSSSGPPGDAAAADATAKAVAFKDRLVEYDRHAQKRTTVIDDQSDFFEIETNAWLTEEERIQLRRRDELEAEAAAARRNKVTVTLDLLGRKVVVTDSDSSAAAGSNIAAAGGGSSFELSGGSATQQLLQQVQAAAAKEQHRGGGAGEKQEGGSSEGAAGAAGNKAPEQTLADALAAISNLRISAHPNLTITPVFMPKRKLLQQQEAQAAGSKAAKGQQEGKQQQQQGKQQQGAAKGKKQQAAGSGGKAAAGKAPVKQQRRQRFDAAASRAAAADSRVQDDSIFGDFEAELLCDELLQKQPTASAAAAHA